MNNQIKGYTYELYIKTHIINKLNKQAYLWSETILIENGIIGSHNPKQFQDILVL